MAAEKKNFLPAVVMLFLLFIFVSIAGSSSAIAAEDTAVTGYSEADDNGYVQAEVTLREDQIIDVSLKEFNEMAREKGDDYPWDDWHEAMEVLPQRFVEADDYDVEGVTGATGTSDKAREAVRMALLKTEGVEQFSGTYMGISDIIERGWGVAWVTVEPDEEAPEGYRITDLRLEEVSGDEFKDEDYGWPEFHEAQEEIAESMMQSDTYEVDAYSGATGSSELWMEAVADALEKAGF